MVFTTMLKNVTDVLCVCACVRVTGADDNAVTAPFIPYFLVQIMHTSFYVKCL